MWQNTIAVWSANRTALPSETFASVSCKRLENCKTQETGLAVLNVVRIIRINAWVHRHHFLLTTTMVSPNTAHNRVLSPHFVSRMQLHACTVECSGFRSALRKCRMTASNSIMPAAKLDPEALAWHTNSFAQHF